YPLWQVTERDEVTVEIADLIFVRLAHIENEDVILTIEAPFEFLRSDLRNRNAVLLFFTTDTTELLIVDEGSNRGRGAADGAFGVLAQLELAEAHAKGIDQEEPPRECVA